MTSGVVFAQGTTGDDDMCFVRAVHNTHGLQDALRVVTAVDDVREAMMDQLRQIGIRLPWYGSPSFPCILRRDSETRAADPTSSTKLNRM